MMTKEDVLEVAEGSLEFAKELLQKDGELGAVVIGIPFYGNPDPLMVGEGNEQELITQASTTSQAVLYILNALTKDLAPGEARPTDLTSDPKASSAIVCMVFTPEGTWFKRIHYISENGWYNWVEFGWEDGSDELCKNPYKG